MSLSLLVWREFPNSIQWVGMSLAVSAIAIVNWPGSRRLADALKPALLLLFLFGGLAEFSNKFYQKYALTDFKVYFLLTTFAVAFVWSLIATLRRLQPVSRRDVLRKAHDLMAIAPERPGPSLLYLSSLIEREEAPIR